ncbi:MAG: ExbD/TolR family protein [Ignavibacteriaceae bacterium]
MAKVKVPRKSTNIDMTAMCDVAFLLLTFFMLTTKFKADDAVIVDTPSSISEIKLPDSDIMSITVNKEGQIFFGIDGKYNREKLLEKISEKFSLQFTDDEKYNFSLISSFGVPLSKLQSFLALTPSEREVVKQPGIPCDSALNELGFWVIYGRLSNPNFRIAIRGDQDVSYPVIKRVMNTLQEKNVNKFNLITDLEVRPS